MNVRGRLIAALLLLVAVPVWAQTQPSKPSDKPAEKAPTAAPKPAEKAPAPAPKSAEKAPAPAPKPTASAMGDKAMAEIGKPAPEFTLKDIEGKEQKLSQYKGKVVVLEWVNHECPVCKRHAEAKTATNIMGKFKDKPVVYLGIDSSHFAETKMDGIKKWAKEFNITYPVLIDAPGKVGKSYGAKTTPHVFVIDQAGKLAYMGAIDDDPEGTKKDKAKNYVEAAVTALLNNSAVATTTTEPYGCTVKYKPPMGG